VVTNREITSHSHFRVRALELHRTRGAACPPETETIKLLQEATVGMESLQDLYVEELRDLYSAEKQILKALPKMAKKASHQELRAAFQDHLEATKEHVVRLETIFDELEVSPRGRTCRGMEGLLEEGEEVMEEEAEPDVMDAALIASAQRVEHYEIAGYGTVRTYAERLGFSDQSRLLQQTLDEEGETDRLLTQIAEDRVNPDAERAG
jgi:ferritin-like metal-binding protein YciE